MDNKDIVKKADMALGDLATAGRLNPEQTDQFIRTLIEQPTILQSVRTVGMNSPEMYLNKIGFGSRILRAGVENTALSQSDRVKPDLGKVHLQTSEVIAEVNLPYAVLEDNIERGNIGVPLQGGAGGLHQTIVDMIAERASTDLEELAIYGDTSNGSDSYLALVNGYLKLANANIVNAGNAPVSKDVLKAALKALPPKYLRDRSKMTHFVSVNNETELRDQYSNRQTALGDSNTTANLPLMLHGTKVAGVPLMPESAGLFTNPLNLIFGIQRNIMIEYDKDIRARQFIIVLTARMTFSIEENNALVSYQNIGSS